MTTELLTDDKHSRQSLQMMRQAIVHNWDIPEELFSALPKIAGAMAIKGTAKEKIAAMRVLLAMKEQNEKPEPQQQQQGTTINVGVNVDNRTDERRNLTLAIAERVRAGRVLGVDSGD